MSETATAPALDAETADSLRAARRRLLLIIDLIERELGITPRTSELRRDEH